MTTRLYSGATLPGYNKNNLGDLIVCLKAALITGHGVAPSAGWAMLYESIAYPGDATMRIVVQSQAADSEQIIFEIEDISVTKATIKCWQSWSGSTGSELLMSAQINKDGYANFVKIVASDRFVHCSINAVYYGFGDVNPIISTDAQTVILARNNDLGTETAHAIASTNKPYATAFVNIAGDKLVCRSFCAEDLGYGARIGLAPAPVYDLYAGGDKGNLITGKVSPVRATELLRRQPSGVCDAYAYIPSMIYTDNPQSMNGHEITVNNQRKKIVILESSSQGFASFMVDL